MSYNKGENITQAELNAVISVFKHFHQDKETITPNELNELEDCTFEFTNGIYTNEEYIFENNIECKIIKDHNYDLGEHYQIACKYYEYGIDPDDETAPELKSGIFDLEPQGDNIYKSTLDSDVIYMQLTNIVLITRYDNKIIVKAD